jgi:hypothetical protein
MCGGMSQLYKLTDGLRSHWTPYETAHIHENVLAQVDIYIVEPVEGVGCRPE